GGRGMSNFKAPTSKILIPDPRQLITRGTAAQQRNMKQDTIPENSQEISPTTTCCGSAIRPLQDVPT
ncbi:MAG TPA: hypothetical protein VMM56_17010, partial [Planctomycetaceae bacterium]|nr:hypothetical protein [Planctomycetaceae bacterium]